MKGTFPQGSLSFMSLSHKVLLIGRRGNSKRQGPLMSHHVIVSSQSLKIYLLPFPHCLPTGGPVTLCGRWSHTGKSGVALLLLGYSMGVDEAHSELLTLSPRHGRNIVYNCEAGAPAKQRQYAVRYKKLEASCFCNTSSWKRNQSHTFRLCLGSAETCEL